MADYPDWTRLFYLSGVAITIPINIESSDIVLPISIDAATATVDINIAAAAVTIDFNFADQSVAVFDAAKWFAHQATQVFLWGSALIGNNTCGTVTTYTVPAGKTLYIVGCAYSSATGALTPTATRSQLSVAASYVFDVGSLVGTGIPLDTPVRATTGQQVLMAACQYGTGASMTMYGSLWGYLETD